jgi:hypothetical protein
MPRRIEFNHEYTTTLRTFILRPKISKSIHPKYTRNEQSIYRLKELVISYNRDDYRRNSFDNYPTYLTTRITNKREYIHLCITGRMPIRKMSIKTLRSTPIRIGRLYHRWIRINKTNKTHVSYCRNSKAFVFYIENTQLTCADTKNVDQDAEVYTNQNRTLIPPLDSD